MKLEVKYLLPTSSWLLFLNRFLPLGVKGVKQNNGKILKIKEKLFTLFD